MIAILFARGDSIYKTLPDCDVWDVERDARTWPGGCSCVCHPPCRAWGRLKHFARPRPDEKDLARFAVAMVRKWGGVLEHPAASQLWTDQGLPEVGGRDASGGFTIALPQFWFGHLANKATKLYVCGCEPKELPEVPLILGEATRVISTSSGNRALGMPKYKMGMSQANRERTPEKFARWLCDVARICQGGRAA